MSTMTIDDVRRILVACAGETDAAAFDGDIDGVEFEELGYDSLALMETAARIEQEYGVRIPDERIADLRTPRELVDLVNDAAARTS
ncbi:acyl carrier protein [Micromonospora purpureochromogenes]|uniref:acyl carrier protein n=1 Tax=Micromonospora purpureochromogenes TaxID=47872 RepID=UPI0033EC4A00